MPRMQKANFLALSFYWTTNSIYYDCSFNLCAAAVSTCLFYLLFSFDRYDQNRSRKDAHISLCHTLFGPTGLAFSIFWFTTNQHNPKHYGHSFWLSFFTFHCPILFKADGQRRHGPGWSRIACLYRFIHWHLGLLDLAFIGLHDRLHIRHLLSAVNTPKEQHQNRIRTILSFRRNYFCAVSEFF